MRFILFYVYYHSVNIKFINTCFAWFNVRSYLKSAQRAHRSGNNLYHIVQSILPDSLQCHAFVSMLAKVFLQNCENSVKIRVIMYAFMINQLR